MYYFYVLWSEKLERYYFGYSADLKKRLAAHNSGKERFTSRGVPWKLVYYEAYLSEKDARKREQTVKHRGNTMAFIKKRIQESLNVARQSIYAPKEGPASYQLVGKVTAYQGYDG